VSPQLTDAPHPFQADRFIGADTDEIDTTPTDTNGATYTAPRPVDIMRDSPPDEIDTTPQPERRSEPRAVDPHPAPPPVPASSAGVVSERRSLERAPIETNRPKRSGWWQRKSFF
jgi:hypothetical protein